MQTRQLHARQRSSTGAIKWWAWRGRSGASGGAQQASAALQRTWSAKGRRTGRASGGSRAGACREHKVE